MIPNPIVVPLGISESTQQVQLGISQNLERFVLGLASPIQIVTGEHYRGATEVTPSAEEQVLQTEGLFVDSNITVKPIPQNYGLITWNGSTLTVS